MLMQWTEKGAAAFGRGPCGVNNLLLKLEQIPSHIPYMFSLMKFGLNTV